MKKLLVLALAIPAVASAASVAPKTSTPVTLATSGPVVALAADGDRVAFAVSGRRRWQIVVWEPRARRVIPIYTTGSCGGYCGPGGGLALAGTRVAWDEAGGGNDLETYIESATLARRAPVELGSGDLAMRAVGDVLLGPVGDGRLIAFTDEVHCDEEDEPLCPPGHQTGDISAATVWRAARRGRCPENGIDQFPAGHCARVARANGELTVLAVDAGRIAARTDDGVRLLTGRGGHLRDFPVEKVSGAALSGNRLAIRVPGAVEIYDTGSGELVTRLPAARGLRLEDLEGGILVTASGRTISLRRLRDGRTATIRRPGIVHAQLEPSGLFITAGRSVTFTPMSDVLRRLGGSPS